MRKRFGKALALALVATTALASFGGTAGAAEVDPTFSINATCYDWGEAITSVVIDMGKPVDESSVDVEDFTYSATVTYFSYATFSNVTEDVTRVIKSVEVDGSKITLHLETEFNDTHKVYPDSVENSKLTLVGDIKSTSGTLFSKDISFTCTSLMSPTVDAFIEGETDKLNYRLYVPKSDKAEALVVWLHGGGEGGRDNRKQISANLVTAWISEESQNALDTAYILAPQYNETTNRHDPESVMDAIEKVMSEYNIDPRRIYVGGCSMGGMGTIDMITKYPTFFAAAFPICPASQLTEAAAEAIATASAKFSMEQFDTEDEAVKYGSTAVYFIHSIDDTTCTPANSMISYNRLIDAYANVGVSANDAPVHITLFKQVEFDGLPPYMASFLGHWSWVYVHNNFDCEGNDYDGRNFLDPTIDIEQTDESNYYVKDGLVYFRHEINIYYYDFGNGPELVTDWSIFTQFGGTVELDESKLTTESETEWISTPSMKLTDLTDNACRPYTSFFDWLSDQVVEVVGYAPTHPEVVVDDLYDEYTYTLDYTVGNDDKMYYYLYDPVAHGADPDTKYPLVVVFHGAGNGMEGSKCVSYTDMAVYATPEYQAKFAEGGAYLLFPKANEYREENYNAGTWMTDTDGDNRSDYNKAVHAIIDEVISQHPSIDAYKVAVGGTSAGGYMTWSLLSEYADEYAAAFLIAAAKIPTTDELKWYDELNLPIWIIHGINDELIKYDVFIEPLIPMFEKMENVRLTSLKWIRYGDYSLEYLPGMFTGVPMSQHLALFALGSNLIYDDGTPYDRYYPEGFIAWLNDSFKAAEASKPIDDPEEPEVPEVPEEPQVPEVPSDEPDTPVTSQTYTVVQGDTLWGIAKRLTGSGLNWEKIYDANRTIIKNPDMIYVGQTLVIPK